MKPRYKMEHALQLARKIKNKSLREKVIHLLTKPELKNPEFVYPAAKFDKIPAWPASTHHSYEGGELDHTVSVTKIALSLAEHFEDCYEVKFNKDHIIAGGLLHDIGKVFILKKDDQWGFTGCQMDHADLGAQILYAHDFPEEVVHIVASHGGDLGQAGANPRTLEALVVFYADVIDSTLEMHIRPTSSPLQLLLTPEERK